VKSRTKGKEGWGATSDWGEGNPETARSEAVNKKSSDYEEKRNRAGSSGGEPSRTGNFSSARQEGPVSFPWKKSCPFPGHHREGESSSGDEQKAGVGKDGKRKIYTVPFAKTFFKTRSAKSGEKLQINADSLRSTGDPRIFLDRRS